MIKYIGSKRTLIPAILSTVRAIPGTASVIDLFSGTSRVGHALKAQGYRVLANDFLASIRAPFLGWKKRDRSQKVSVK